MSWNGTVTCGYCYQTGHNKRGCPSRKKAALSNTRIARQLENEKASHSKRACSFCDESGHNIRTCKTKFTKAFTLQKKELELRHAFVKQIKEQGLAPGAIVTKESWASGPIHYLITDINWNRVNIAAVSDDFFSFEDVTQFIRREYGEVKVFKIKLITKGAKYPEKSCGMPGNKKSCLKTDRYYNTILVSPGVSEMIEVPEDFLKMRSLVEIKNDLKGVRE
tara:strand:+ start:6725 stop:7387 length:663 start_codon:yes stop_codon:yes gene_type:complete